MSLESLRERALELTEEVRAKIAAVQCIYLKDGIGIASSHLDQYDNMLDRMEMKLTLDLINTRSGKKRYIEIEDNSEILELAMFIEMMQVISNGFDKGEMNMNKQKRKGFQWI